MSANEIRQSVIGFAMFKHRINKKKLACLLSLSYPTILSKLKDTGSFKISEADLLCKVLNIELTELLNIKNYENE
tara:strand:+ start:11760 stop:11984 length:225 start_codon:yes stop_codon:yes gene_type:complete